MRLELRVLINCNYN